MKRTIVIYLVLLILFFCKETFSNELVWEKISQDKNQVYAVWLNPQDSKIIYLVSNNSLYLTYDGGKSWQMIFSFKSRGGKINFIYVDEYSSIFLGTSHGLYLSNDKGKSFQRVFVGKDSLESNSHSLIALNKRLILATHKGLFISDDQAKTWYKPRSKLATDKIISLASISFPSILYVLSTDGLFKSDDCGDNFKLIKATINYREEEKSYNNEELYYEDSEPEQNYYFKNIFVDPQKPNLIYLSTCKEIFVSKDFGQNWTKLTSDNSLPQNIDFIFVSVDSQLFVVAKNKIFLYQNNLWREISLRLPVKKIYCLAYDKEKFLYAGTDSGLYKTNIKEIFSNHQEFELISLENIPKIQEIQEQAMKYAEVEPEKIKIWRKQVVKRALLPKLNVNLDFDRNRTISNNIYTYSGKWYVLPNDVTTYNNHNWGITLTWELGDLVWNDAQISIDVRSRLNTQLRNEILDEVTRLYYEWIRLKIELNNVNIEGRKKIIEKKIKIQEITSLLDAYTGGYFSRNLKP